MFACLLAADQRQLLRKGTCVCAAFYVCFVSVCSCSCVCAICLCAIGHALVLNRSLQCSLSANSNSCTLLRKGLSVFLTMLCFLLMCMYACLYGMCLCVFACTKIKKYITVCCICLCGIWKTNFAFSYTCSAISLQLVRLQQLTSNGGPVDDKQVRTFTLFKIINCRFSRFDYFPPKILSC